MREKEGREGIEREGDGIKDQPRSVSLYSSHKTLCSVRGGSVKAVRAQSDDAIGDQPM
jgi:hypothetical protein